MKKQYIYHLKYFNNYSCQWKEYQFYDVDVLYKAIKAINTKVFTVSLKLDKTLLHTINTDKYNIKYEK